MYIFAAFFSALIGLFLWMYLLTYFMSQGASTSFFSRARVGFLRGVIVAAVFIVFDTVPILQSFIGRDWIIFPLIFFTFTLPFSWKRVGKNTLIPVILGVILFGLFSFFLESAFVWSPFHEEVGKWYQSITSQYPAIMSPFVSLGFSFLENIRYYSVELNLGQVIGRNVFSLPLHLFAGLLAFWCMFSVRSKILGTFLGILAAVSIHTLYNWSLSYSLMVTLGIMVTGYAFYGWSLENGWWKAKL